ncbi:PCMD domain-containing protein [Prolixibacteraceae bacterium Z1-6]|uniref:PCMD domain-containing protein n=1 Tax=Draconibacterium aestuarii TaxID=2998507 RepID=A0A9X3FDS3_9BACT|nr:PCMD domain-containing protein [Prolixibacteraceae bacterium Z1-6]
MKKIFLALVLVSFFACSDDGGIDGPASDKAEILGFTVEANAGFNPVYSYIDEENGEVHVFAAVNFDDLTFPIKLIPVISVSEGASIVPALEDEVTFDDPEDFVEYTVTSEDGLNSKDYIFTIRDTQIPNAGFENWYTETGMNSQPFQEPGKYKESTVWATANMGTSIYSIYGTSQLNDGDNSFVKIETVTTVALPLVAGALYIGKFDLDGAIENPTDPVAAAKLGIPFHEKPVAVQFKYSYKSGDQLIQAILKDPGNLFGGFDVINLEGTDKFGIEIALEQRVGEAVSVIAKKVFQSAEEVAELTNVRLDLDYMSNDAPTHLYISFSPSYDGGTFKGAVGSTLIIDDVELIYE